METSESFFNEILSGGPSQGTLFLVLSSMKKEGLVDRVAEECAKALEIYPDDVRIRKLRAEACYEAGRLLDAESEIKTVIGKIDELAASYRLLADLCIAGDKTSEAVEALKLYLIHRPDDKESYALLESLTPKDEARSEIQHAAEELQILPVEEVVEPAPQRLEAELPDIATPTLAEVYHSQGKTKEAIETYEKVLDRSPEDSGARMRLDELKNILEQTPAIELKRNAVITRKREIASILETWLAGIREQSRAGI